MMHASSLQELATIQNLGILTRAPLVGRVGRHFRRILMDYQAHIFIMDVQYVDNV